MDKNRWLRYGVGFVVLFLVGVFLRLARPILIPFAMALLFAFAVSPVLDFLVRPQGPQDPGPGPRPGPVLRRPLPHRHRLLLRRQVPRLRAAVLHGHGPLVPREASTQLVPDPRLKVGLTDWIQNLNIGQARGPSCVSALGPFLSFMSDLLLVFVFMIFILAGRGRLIRKIDEAFPPGPAAALSRTACADRPRDPEVPGRQDPGQRPHRRPHGVRPGRLRGPLRPRLRRAGLPLQLRPDARSRSSPWPCPCS
ncbi:MAG: hypothetical protein MZU95_07270, partial [Desulfomicrobium escambiense]|nr:hypothetical protein [Desulfomicrobium escambiense]